MRPLLTTHQVAEQLGVSIFTVRNLVEAGKLPAIRLRPGSPFRFRPEDVESLAAPNVGAAA